MNPSVDALNLLRDRLLIRAPTPRDAERRLVEHRLDPADLAFLEFEELGELPGPVDPIVIEERERKDDAALAVDGDKSPVADAIHNVIQRISGELRETVVGGCCSVLKANAPFSERVVSLAIVPRERGEVVVRLSDEFLARGSLRA